MGIVFERRLLCVSIATDQLVSEALLHIACSNWPLEAPFVIKSCLIGFADGLALGTLHYVVYCVSHVQYQYVIQYHTQELPHKSLQGRELKLSTILFTFQQKRRWYVKKEKSKATVLVLFAQRHQKCKILIFTDPMTKLQNYV